MAKRRGHTASTRGRQTPSGTCQSCGQDVTRDGVQQHLAACAPAHDVPTAAPRPLVFLRATSPEMPAYWLDVEAKADAKLEALDAFLRRVWLECCGHLSVFRIGGVDYFSRGYEFGFGHEFAGIGTSRSDERSMTVRLRDVLPFSSEGFEYEYDFGSTTNLELRVTGERSGCPGRSAVRLLVRNVPPASTCAVCGEPATLVCAFCLQEAADAFVCPKHRRQHRCGEEEGFLPVVNSPRMGVCGYTGGRSG
jgi:hypothetical protein